MKTFIIIFVVLVVAIIVLLKLITSREPITSPDISVFDSNRESERLSETLNSERFDVRRSEYKKTGETHYPQSVEPVENNRKLMAFAKAFVQVQSYMNTAGRNTNYKETSKIVQRQGLSVMEYTRIATLMNENPEFRDNVQKMISEVKAQIR